MISPPNVHRLATCWQMVFGVSPEEARFSMNGRKQTTRARPGGKSFSTPIHEVGHSSRSRQSAETSMAATAFVARFTLEFFLCQFILCAMELITILNQCHHHRGFVYQHA